MGAALELAAPDALHGALDDATLTVGDPVDATRDRLRTRAKWVGMIVVVGRVGTDAERRADLIRVGQTVARASREEIGCINYGLYQDTENENEFVLVEEWESEAAHCRRISPPRTSPSSCRRSRRRSWPRPR